MRHWLNASIFSELTMIMQSLRKSAHLEISGVISESACPLDLSNQTVADGIDVACISNTWTAIGCCNS